MKRLMTMLAAVAAVSAVTADQVPEISGVTMEQPTHSRRVTIGYTLANASAVVTLDVQTNRTGAATADEADWVSIGGENIRFATGDVWKKVEAGTRTITWRADQSWRGHKVDAARAVVTAWSLDNPPDYMVVNLSDSALANSETYYPAEGYLPGGLLDNPDYRTTKLVMRKIPAKGVTWTMGSAESEIGRDGSGSEAPHDVTLDANYYIGVFPVTQAQCLRFMTKKFDFAVEGTMRPAGNVNYTEITDTFLNLLNTKTGLSFALPSEAQWEFACRAGNGSGYWGDGSPILTDGEDANLARLGRTIYNGGQVKGADGSYTYPSSTVGPENGPSIVGSYAPNAWGLYDMHGNVWEWCRDWYKTDITSLNGAVNEDAGTLRVRRGGSFNSNAKPCRAAYRGSRDPSKDSADGGFRLALPIAAE